MSILVRAGEGDIIVGKPIQKNVYDGKRKLLLRQGNLITSQKQIDTLIQRGVFFIPNEDDLSRQTESREPLSKSSSFELLDSAYARLEHLYTVSNLSGNLPNKNLQSAVVRVCKTIQEACDEDRDACLSTILLQTEGRYSVFHQIHTAIACEVILRHMNYSPQKRLSVLAAGLTMNIGMSELQDALFSQKEKLSKEQHRQIQAHLFEGVERLRQSGIEDQLWINTVFQHHELLDGSGYPQKLQGDAILEPSRILTIADIYCAKVTGRTYRKPLPANLALKEIFCKDRGHSIDIGLSHIFIKELGIYPPGSFVRLVNSEIAVVTRKGRTANCPIVRSIIKPNGDTYQNPRYRDCGEKEFAIRDILTSKDFKAWINRTRLWNKNLEEEEETS